MKTEVSTFEFRFSCPQCKGAIQCDISYVGAQIDCPICHKSIVVPPAPPKDSSVGERKIQLKTSTLIKAGLIAACALLIMAVVMLIPYFFGPKSVTFRAYVDGTDVVKLSGRHLWVEHLDFQLPARVSINGVNWQPDWNDNKTTRYSLKRVFRSANPQNIKLSKHIGRGTVGIIETPSRENGQTLGIQVDDGPFGGAAWYEFTVTW